MLVDLTLRGVQSGTYHVTVRQTGDISRGAESTGAVWNGNDDDRGLRGYWGEVEVRRDGKGSVFLDRKVRITEMIGRAMVASKASPEADGTRFSEHEEATVVGVIARSAGLWDNEKTVCSCSGKNVWDERKEQVGKGMM
jgi:copper chaperone for superoxide dismutase